MIIMIKQEIKTNTVTYRETSDIHSAGKVRKYSVGAKFCGRRPKIPSNKQFGCCLELYVRRTRTNMFRFAGGIKKNI